MSTFTHNTDQAAKKQDAVLSTGGAISQGLGRFGMFSMPSAAVSGEVDALNKRVNFHVSQEQAALSKDVK